jgi:hypothetical protein
MNGGLIPNGYRTFEDAVRAQNERIAAKQAADILAASPVPDTVPEEWEEAEKEQQS